MDDDDFLSELGITNKKPASTQAPATGNGKTATTQVSTAPRAMSTPMVMKNTSSANLVDKKKTTKKPVRQQSDQQDDLQSWLAASPRDNPTALAAKRSAEGRPLILEEDDTFFEPASPSTRFQQYASAFVVDEDDFSMALAEEQPFLTIAKSHMKEDLAVRLIASWKHNCGCNLSDAKVTNRCVSFLSALVLYHDPKLWAFLQMKKFDFARPSLFEFYAPTTSEYSPIFELWDASLLSALPGYETPTQGSIVFALALLLCNRDAIMTSTNDLEAIVDSLRTSSDVRQAIVVGSRAAKLTSEYFLRLVGEPEMEWNEYDKLLSTEDKRSPASPPPPTLQKRDTASMKRQDSNKSEAAATGAMNTMSSWMSALKPSGPITTASLKSGFNSFTNKLSESLQGTIDDEDAPQPRVQVRKRTISESRHLFIVEYPGVRKLGLQLGQTASSGLTVLGFDKSQEISGEAEQEGTVIAGDAVHSVNWVSVSCLPAAIAGKVIAKQERPLHITFSTANAQNRKMPKGLSLEAKSMQFAILKARLLSFYSRFGQSKLDDVTSILRIYAKHEKSLVRGLYHKYGEPIPGDGSFASEFVLVSAAEALAGGLMKPTDDDSDPDDLIFVDVRTKEEREDTGTLSSTFCLTFDNKDEKVMKAIVRGVKEKSNRTKICLLASGTFRMFSLVDPARAAEEKGKDDRRLLMAARKLSEAGMNCICAIRGGFAECFREATLRQTPFTSDMLTDCGHGYLYKACEAYALVDYKDTESLGRFIVAYFTDFKEVILPPPPPVDAATGSGVSSAPIPVQRSISQESMQNLQTAFSTLVPSGNITSLFNKGAPGGAKGDSGRSSKNGTNNEPKAPTPAPPPPPPAVDIGGFTIDDD